MAFAGGQAAWQLYSECVTCKACILLLSRVKAHEKQQGWRNPASHPHASEKFKTVPE